jgi:hypothetical protein
MRQRGYPVSPECGGEFQLLPLRCGGCGITYLDMGNISNYEVCQYCNYNLSSSNINKLKSGSLRSLSVE